MGILSLWSRLLYEWQGPFTIDSPIYWAVGRGILNGLTPYRDLFETKPPGIFVLSSLSLWVGGDMRLGAMLQTLTFAFMPLVVIAGAMRTHSRGHRGLECTIFLAAVAFGCLLTLYSAERSGEFQVESFGALFITAYAAFLAKNHASWNIRHMLIASFLLYCGVGIKEPFILTALACSLSLAEHPRDVLRTFLVPSIIAGVAGVVTLALLGWLEPYVDLYLPEMLGRHIQEGSPLWKRGFFFEGTFKDIRAFAPAFSFLIVGLAAAFILRLHGNRKIKRALFLLTALALSLYLLMLSIGTGGHFWNHHYVFAIPGYAALFIVFVRTLRTHWHRLAPRFGVVVFAVITLSASMHIPTPEYTSMIGRLQNDGERMQAAADYIDNVLDTCDIDRYLFLGGNGSHPYGLTTHSPIGPLFLQYDEWLKSDRPEFREKMLEQVDSSFFIVKDSMNMNWLNVPIGRHLAQYFTTTPWPCAAGILQDGRYEYLFRYAQPSFPLSETAPNFLY